MNVLCRLLWYGHKLGKGGEQSKISILTRDAWRADQKKKTGKNVIGTLGEDTVRKTGVSRENWDIKLATSKSSKAIIKYKTRRLEHV